MNWTVGALAEKLGGTVEGDAAAPLRGMAGLADAAPGDVTFLANPRYEGLLRRTRATAVVVHQAWQGDAAAAALIRVPNPDKAFTAIAAFLGPPPIVRAPGVHPTAVVGSGARLGADVHVGACTVIEDGAVIGDRCVIEAQCFVGRDASIGEDGHLYPQVAVRDGVRIGRRAILHCGVVIGSDGFGYTVERHSNGMPVVEKIPQIGIVVIGDDVEIGANVTIDRARFGQTRIGNCVKIDNLVQIGHNVQIGDFTGIIAQSGVAGSAQIGRGVMLWAQSGVSGHLHVADGAQIGPQAGVSKDVAAGDYVIGTPAVSKREFAAGMAAPRQVEKLKLRLAELEARLERMEKHTES